MSLINDPSLLIGTSGNALPLTPLNHYPISPSSISFNLNFTNVLGGFIQIWSYPSGGTVNAVNGTLIQGYSSSDNVWYDTIPYGGVNLSLPTVVGSVQRQSIQYDTGQYQFTLTNQDPSNPIYVLATTGLLT